MVSGHNHDERESIVQMFLYTHRGELLENILVDL